MARTARLIQSRQQTLREKRNRYTDKFRAGALALVEASVKTSTEGKILEVAEHLNIPIGTLKHWVRDGVNPPDPEVMNETREGLRELLQLEMMEIFKEMKKAREDASYRDLSIGFGILFDKTQLLDGKSTENVQSAITFVRQGLSSLPEHLAPRAIADHHGEETI